MASKSVCALEPLCRRLAAASWRSPPRMRRSIRCVVVEEVGERGGSAVGLVHNHGAMPASCPSCPHAYQTQRTQAGGRPASQPSSLPPFSVCRCFASCSQPPCTAHPPPPRPPVHVNGLRQLVDLGAPRRLALRAPHGAHVLLAVHLAAHALVGVAKGAGKGGLQLGALLLGRRLGAALPLAHLPPPLLLLPLLAGSQAGRLSSWTTVDLPDQQSACMKRKTNRYEGGTRSRRQAAVAAERRRRQRPALGKAPPLLQHVYNTSILQAELRTVQSPVRRWKPTFERRWPPCRC